MLKTPSGEHLARTVSKDVWALVIPLASPGRSTTTAPHHMPVGARDTSCYDAAQDFPRSLPSEALRGMPGILVGKRP